MLKSTSVSFLALLLALSTFDSTYGFTTTSITSHHAMAPRLTLNSRTLPSRTFTNCHRLPSSLSDEKFLQKNGSCLHMSTTAADEAPEPVKKGPSLIASISSTVALVALDIGFRRLLKSLSISFPSSLAGCGTLFTLLVTLCTVNESLGDGLYNLLSPGAAVLAKWLPVFFVPSLVTLPLAQSLGSSMEVLKVGAVVVAGFFFTLFSTAFSVIGIRKILGTAPSTDAPSLAVVPSTTAEESTPPPKPFSDATFNRLVAGAATSAIATIAAIKSSASIHLITPMTALTMLCTTLASFTFGARLPKSFTKTVHPLVTCTTLTWTAMKLFALSTGQSFRSMLTSYKVGSTCPVHLGAGDLLLFMLGPAVVALACQMYDRKKLMKENIAEVGTAVGVSSIGGLFGTAAMARLFNVGNPMLRLCLLSRNITSPLAMAIAGILGADVSLAVSMVVVTGLIGANFGAAILDAVGVKDAVARGLGIGAAAHGLGTAAFANEKDAFPFAAISMALTASACTVLVSIPTVKKMVLKVALGV